jgi:tRNA dimethylallyltransferase
VADRLRVIRALEITTLTGTPASTQRDAHAFVADRYPHTLYVLNPEREWLYPRINARAKAMFDGGLLEETRALIDRGWRDTAPMRSVGYVQAVDCLDGKLTREQAIADLAQATRHFAKRQFTWFKKERGGTFLTPPWNANLIG